ncbi:unnamed protein product [Microthlaspi erraticum]|uniref:Myb-like domain-containing protein n=1 Tax=Microthlaspi erraticum TaxID=1685480 RepID=A0A6D2HD20_9BRAS|nr:unnamed protein product [Microthlaspi erraticum]
MSPGYGTFCNYFISEIPENPSETCRFEIRSHKLHLLSIGLRWEGILVCLIFVAASKEELLWRKERSYCATYQAESSSPSMGLGSPQVPHFGTQISESVEEKPEGRSERRRWSQTEDIVLCSSWLNTSKDPLMGNEQKGDAFWKCIADYFNASTKLDGFQRRESNHCKLRWHRINELVCKFVGCYESAQRQKSSGYNEADVLKMAYDIFYADYKLKFNLEYAWIELRNDQKWCAQATFKGDGSSKKRKEPDQSASTFTPQARPEGVKAAKAKGKRSASNSGTAESAAPSAADFQNMLNVKDKDLDVKNRMLKVRLLECLISRTESLTPNELALKDKLVTEMLSN